MSRHDDAERVRRASEGHKEQRLLGQKAMEAETLRREQVEQFGEQLARAKDETLARLAAQGLPGVQMINTGFKWNWTKFRRDDRWERGWPLGGVTNSFHGGVEVTSIALLADGQFCLQSYKVSDSGGRAFDHTNWKTGPRELAQYLEQASQDFIDVLQALGNTPPEA